MNNRYNINLKNGILEWKSKFYSMLVKCGFHGDHPKINDWKRFKSPDMIIILPLLIGELFEALKMYEFFFILKITLIF